MNIARGFTQVKKILKWNANWPVFLPRQNANLKFQKSKKIHQLFLYPAFFYLFSVSFVGSALDAVFFGSFPCVPWIIALDLLPQKQNHRRHRIHGNRKTRFESLLRSSSCPSWTVLLPLNFCLVFCRSFSWAIVLNYISFDSFPCVLWLLLLVFSIKNKPRNTRNTRKIQISKTKSQKTKTRQQLLLLCLFQIPSPCPSWVIALALELLSCLFPLFFVGNRSCFYLFRLFSVCSVVIVLDLQTIKKP